MRDTVNVMREGIPAVALVHEPFAALARLQVGLYGPPDAPLLIYPRDLTDREPPDVLAQKARKVADEAAELLLGVGR